ncbi:MAG: hypothetical protein IT249_20025 [Chitinophagaceae bacterium]|nr:hypothetical protein [Chitinophagaceae bacterium]
MKATNKQIQSIHAALHRKGLLRHKAEMVSGFTAGRTTHSSEMTVQEAAALLADINEYTTQQDDRQRMLRYIIAMAHEMGWITQVSAVEHDGKIIQKNDYSRLHSWVLKYGNAKKGMNQYNHQELVKLVAAFKNMHREWLNKPR